MNLANALSVQPIPAIQSTIPHQVEYALPMQQGSNAVPDEGALSGQFGLEAFGFTSTSSVFSSSHFEEQRSSVASVNENTPVSIAEEGLTTSTAVLTSQTSVPVPCDPSTCITPVVAGIAIVAPLVAGVLGMLTGRYMLRRIMAKGYLMASSAPNTVEQKLYVWLGQTLYSQGDKFDRKKTIINFIKNYVPPSVAKPVDPQDALDIIELCLNEQLLGNSEIRQLIGDFANGEQNYTKVRERAQWALDQCCCLYDRH